MASFIPIDKIESGMVLAKALMNRFNQVLLPTGTKLEEQHKRILKTWNITSVYVNTNGEKSNNDIPNEILEAAREKVQQRVLWEPRNLIEKEIIEMAVLAIAHKMYKD